MKNEEMDKAIEGAVDKMFDLPIFKTIIFIIKIILVSILGIIFYNNPMLAIFIAVVCTLVFN